MLCGLSTTTEIPYDVDRWVALSNVSAILLRRPAAEPRP